MTTTIVKGQNAVRPTVTPLTSTLLDHVTPVETNDFGMRNDEGLWPSYNCLDLFIPTSICPNPQAEYKDFTFSEWQPGYAFAVYGGVQCLTVGLDQTDMVAETKRVFAANEAKGVEQSLLLSRFVASDPGDKTLLDREVSWDAPEDVTPAGDVSLVVALALLEGTAAREYAGLPTIHMPRAAATVLASNGLIVWTDGKAYTKSGSKVAMGGGYDDAAMLESGMWDLYATGEVYVERSSMVDVQAFSGGVNSTGSDENGIRANTTITLAERMYRVAVDCLVLKATGKVF